MQVHYCDICDSVLKEKKHVVIIFEDAVVLKAYSSDRKQPVKDTFEICDSCLQIVKTIFKYKKSKSKELKDIVDRIYEIKSKVKRKRRKKKGNNNE